MPNLDGESYSDVTLSFLCLIFCVSSRLILSYLISSRFASSCVLWLSYLIDSVSIVFQKVGIFFVFSFLKFPLQK